MAILTQIFFYKIVKDIFSYIPIDYVLKVRQVEVKVLLFPNLTIVQYFLDFIKVLLQKRDTVGLLKSD